MLKKIVPLQNRKEKMNMIQLTLQFENQSIKRLFLKIIELMNGVAVVKPQAKSKTKKCGLDKALEDVEAGRVYKAKDVDDLFRQILD